MDDSFLFRNRAVTPIDFHPSVDLIEENVFLGDLAAATNESLLDSIGINRILTLDIKPLPQHIREKYTCLFIYALDQEDADLLSHFDDAIQFILETRANEKILVHCYFGVSRSATVTIAYVMHKHHLNVDDALTLVKQKRGLICPNSGFMAQLHLFYSMVWRLDEMNLQFRLYKLTNAAKKLLRDKDFSSVTTVDTIDNLSPLQTQYKCKKCRKSLFSESSVFPHDLGKILQWDVDIYSMKNPICEKGLLIGLMTWMNEARRSFSGKLHCPNCTAKLGSFDWNGSKCPCGARMEPIFFIAMDRIDESLPTQTTN